MSKILRRLTHHAGRRADADLLLQIANQIPDGRTICAFGEACAWPVQSFVGKFKAEFEARGTSAADGPEGARPDAVNAGAAATKAPPAKAPQPVSA